MNALRKSRFFAFAGSMLAFAAFAEFEYPADTIFAVPGTYFYKASSIYRDVNGNATNWVDGSYMVLPHEDSGKWPRTTVLYDTFTVRGLRIETHYGGEYFENWGGFWIGAAGLEMTVPGADSAMGRSDSAGLAGRVKLMANQVWKGPVSGDNAVFSFTDDTHTRTQMGSSTYNYHNDFLDADPSVTSWTVQDHLTVWFCHTNALQNVDVRIVDPARIRCRTKVHPNDSSTYYAGLHAKSLTLSGDAEMWQAGGTVKSYQSKYDSTMQPLMDSITLAPTVILENGADIKLVGAQWDIPTLRVTGTGATSSLKGDCTFIRASSDIELQDGATLELAATNRESGVSASLSVTGTGTLRVPLTEWLLTGTLTLGDDVDLELVGSGALTASVVGGKSYVLDPGEDKECMLMQPCTGTAVGKIAIRSGTCYLNSMAAMPANATFEVADGAKLVFATSEGYDDTRVTLVGDGSCSISSLVVLDAPDERVEIVVYTNETLRVFGNGLTAATTVRLAGGTLRFERNGVVAASPLQVTASSFIEAIPSVTGTVAGVVACTNTETATRKVDIPKIYGGAMAADRKVLGLWVLGPGTTVFSGGGAFSNGNGDRIVVTRGACAHFTGGVYRFETKTTSSDYAPIYACEIVSSDKNMLGTGRHICVRDGGELQFASLSSGTVEPKILFGGPKDGSMYDATAYNPVFEIGTGGLVTIPVNSTACFGVTDNRVFLKVTGGTLNLETASSQLYFGSPGAYTACGELFFESGTISTGCAFWRHYGNTGAPYSGTNRLCRGRFIWSGGTLKLNSNFTAPNIFDMSQTCYDFSEWQMSGLLRISTQIIGENCILDLTDMPGASVANVPPVLDEAEWYGHGCLTVKGGKELVMNAVPDGFSLRLEGDGTRVTVPSGAYVYDYDECMKYRNWRGYDAGKPYSVTNNALGALAVSGFTVSGTNCGFTVARDDLPVSVTNTQVTASGEWNNLVSLTAVGGLTAENLAFAEGSLLSVCTKGGKTAPFAIAGTLALPSAMTVRSVNGTLPDAAGAAVFSAAEGVVGKPVWISQTRRFKLESNSNAVWIVPSGTIISVR